MQQGGVIMSRAVTSPPWSIRNLTTSSCNCPKRDASESSDCRPVHLTDDGRTHSGGRTVRGLGERTLESRVTKRPGPRVNNGWQRLTCLLQPHFSVMPNCLSTVNRLPLIWRPRQHPLTSCEPQDKGYV